MQLPRRSLCVLKRSVQCRMLTHPQTALQQEVQSLRRELRLVASAYHEQGLALLRAKSNAASILTAPGAQPTPVSWLVQQRRVHGGLSVLRRT